MNPISEEEHISKVNIYKSRHEIEDHVMDFSNDIPLNNIPNNIPIPIIYVCRYCGMKFGAEMSLITHENNCPTQVNISLPCEICNAMILTTELEAHQINCLRELALRNSKKKHNSNVEKNSSITTKRIVVSDNSYVNNHNSVLSLSNNASNPIEVDDMMIDDEEVVQQPVYEANMAPIEYKSFKNYGNIDNSNLNELLPCEYCSKLFNITQLENHQQLCYKLFKNISYSKPV